MRKVYYSPWAIAVQNHMNAEEVLALKESLEERCPAPRMGKVVIDSESEVGGESGAGWLQVRYV